MILLSYHPDSQSHFTDLLLYHIALCGSYHHVCNIGGIGNCYGLYNYLTHGRDLCTNGLEYLWLVGQTAPLQQ